MHEFAKFWTKSAFYKKRVVAQHKIKFITEDHFVQHMNITTIYN